MIYVKYDIEEFVREPVLSRAREIAERHNMSVEEFIEYVLRRYIEDFYGLESENDVEDDECGDTSDSNEFQDEEGSSDDV